MGRILLYFFYLFMVSVLFSCSATKFVPENEYLLDNVKIITDTRSVKPSGLKPYVRQLPNSKWFSLIKTPLYFYSLTGGRVGDPPVIYDTLSTERSKEEIRRGMQNLGYMGATVQTEEKIKNKKLKLYYRVTAGNPYTLSSVQYDIPDDRILAYLSENPELFSLEEGMRMDVRTLEAERTKITDYLQRRGYYKFNKDYITYTADTIAGTYEVDLTLHLHLFKDNSSDEVKEHPQYCINTINYVIDYDALLTSGFRNYLEYDSIHYKGRPVYYKNGLYIKPRVLVENTRFGKGELYNERAVQDTYSYFGRLSAFKYTNVRFTELEKGDSLLLNSYLMLTKNKFKTIGFDLEGTNSAGDLGAAASTTYSHRNLFRGSELWTLKLRGAYEAISGTKNSNNNYFELGAETSLNFPRFLFPFLSSSFRRNIRASSELNLQYSYQLRPEFARTIAAASWSYKWMYQQKSNHRFDLVDLNFLYMPWIDKEFKENYLDSDNSKYSLLKYNYQDLLIMKIGYSYSYNSAGRALLNNTISNSYSIRFNVESAGNLLYGISKLTRKKRDEDYYKLLNIRYAQYVKGDFDFARNILIDNRNSISFHFAGGIAIPYGNATILPFEKRYFSGGANSVRGWSVRSLGPGRFKGEDTKIDFMNQSGDIKLDASVEYRTQLFWKLKGAAFIDAGNIWTIKKYEDQPKGEFRLKFYEDIALAYGLGIRFDFDFFVLRFDGGMKAINPAYKGKERYPLINPSFSRDFAFHFAVGYPF